MARVMSKKIRRDDNFMTVAGEEQDLLGAACFAETSEAKTDERRRCSPTTSSAA